MSIVNVAKILVLFPLFYGREQAVMTEGKP